MDRPLDSDTLGELGEKEFAGLCAKADLIANPASRDRAGWDYVIDFRLDAALRGLDSRTAPISARIQVKTQWDDKESIKLRLSSAEQLVKHPGPSFICVLSLDGALKFTRMRLIHCRGEIVARVLKRLREAEARAERPNKVWLTINPSDFANATSPDHGALRTGLETACSADLVNYSTAKDAERKTIGFEDGAHELKIKFSASEDEIVDAFLGLRPLSADMVEATETRFGIPLPWEDAPIGPGTMSITPRPEKCSVTFKTKSETFRNRGRAYRPPAQVNAAATRPKMLVRVALLEMAISSKVASDTMSLSVTIGLDSTLPDDVRSKPSEWREAYAILAAISDDGVTMDLKFSGNSTLSQKLQGDFDTAPYWRKLARLTAAADRVFECAGAPNAKVSLQELWNAGDELATMAALIDEAESVTGLTFTTKPEIDIPRPDPINMMLGNAFRVGPHIIAYGGKSTVIGTVCDDEIRWASESFALLGVKRVKSEKEFFAFLDRLPTETYRIIAGVYQTDRSERPARIEAALAAADPEST